MPDASRPDIPNDWGALRSRAASGDMLRRIRLDRDLAQIDLAATSGIQRTAISEIENGHRAITTDTLLRICDALDIDIVLRDRTAGRPRSSAAGNQQQSDMEGSDYA